MLWLLTACVGGLFIIPAAWAAAFLYRRVIPYVVFSDGTRAAFVGRGGQVWGWFVFVGALSLLPHLIGGIAYNGNPFSLILSLPHPDFGNTRGATTAGFVAFLVALPFFFYAQLSIVRWAVAGIELINGPDLSFAGRYSHLLGWLLLFAVSMITIIGWAWAATGFLRWFAYNVEGAGVRSEFVGSGWDLLWRGIAFILVLLVIMITATTALQTAIRIAALIWCLWASVWLLKWITRNVVLVRFTPSPGVTTLET